MSDPNAEPTAALKALCSNCGSPREAGAVFCEVCGLDFTTGKLPAAPPPPTVPAGSPPGAGTSTGWIVVVEVDPTFFETNKTDDTELVLPQGAVAQEIPLRSDEVLIGRRSASANVHPDIDLSSDPGVSRKHAVLQRGADGSWAVIDQGSTNGTRVGGALLPAGERRVVDEGDEVHVGAWTRLTLRREASA